MIIHLNMNNCNTENGVKRVKKNLRDGYHETIDFYDEPIMIRTDIDS